MSRVAIFLIVISLIFGGMMGYSLAFTRLYREVQEQKQQGVGNLNLPPKQAEAPQHPDFHPEAVSFSKVIYDCTGETVLPLDSASEPVIDAISRAADATLDQFNTPNSPLIGLRRINEASRFFEDELLELLDKEPDLICQIPMTKEGKTQRSGYPDLEIYHKPTGRTYYLDPKLYEDTSRDSSLRTFYYTPRSETSKILKPAHHLLIGFSHDGNDGQWKFESWSLVDLSQTKLTLKSEYNASNRDLYEEKTIVRSSEELATP